MQEVTSWWGASTNGYWGSQATSQINSYILDQQQLAALAVGANIQPDLSSGPRLRITFFANGSPNSLAPPHAAARVPVPRRRGQFPIPGRPVQPCRRRAAKHRPFPYPEPACREPLRPPGRTSLCTVAGCGPEVSAVHIRERIGQGRNWKESPSSSCNYMTLPSALPRRLLVYRARGTPNLQLLQSRWKHCQGKVEMSPFAGACKNCMLNCGCR
jgi:hypothetical protein